MFTFWAHKAIIFNHSKLDLLKKRNLKLATSIRTQLVKQAQIKMTTAIPFPKNQLKWDQNPTELKAALSSHALFSNPVLKE